MKKKTFKKYKIWREKKNQKIIMEIIKKKT